MLACWQVRLIPFFAVVAGLVTALNLCEAWPSARLARPGRALVIAAGVALLALGWFGWTNGVHNRDRGVGWSVYADPSLSRAAQGVNTWRLSSGAPPNARVFATHPDVGNYFAWFAPGERTFIDGRLQLFTDVSEDFVALSAGVGLVPGDNPCGDLLRKYDIAAVVVHDPDGGRLTQALSRTGGEWVIARVDGSAVLVTPRDGYAGPAFDPERAAFSGGSDLSVAGAAAPAAEEPPPWWRNREGRGRAGSWQADAATVYIRLAEARPSPSPALPLLAVRAARLGAVVDPLDPIAWLALGRAYAALSGRTWEMDAGADFTLLARVRLLQATGTLARSAVLNPESAPVRESLARLFLRRNILDLGHVHAVAASELVKRAGPMPGESSEAYASRTRLLLELAEVLWQLTSDAENRFLVRTAELAGDPLARARAAAELGLRQKAIDILLASHPDLYGADGVGLLVDLLLETGQATECRVLLDRKELRRNQGALGYYPIARPANPDGTAWTYKIPAYDWFELCQRAVMGDYPDALAAIDRLCEQLRAAERSAGPPTDRRVAVLLAGEVGLSASPTSTPARISGLPVRLAVTGLLTQVRSVSVTRADLATLAGVLELERGNEKGAADRFEEAQTTYAATPRGVLSRPGERLAARYDVAIRGAR
jgi:tetratricopeptide (TPR) repeat protein